MRKLIVFVVVVVLLLLALDRVGDVVAERIVADNLQSSQHLQSRPDVDIDGFPFLTQFATGHYPHVEITAQDARVGSTSLYLSNIDLDFRTVTVSRNFQHFQAQTGTAQARVSYAELTRLLDVRVRYAGNGRLALTKKLPLIGRKTVTFKASYANGTLRFGQLAINGLGTIGGEVLDDLSKYFDVRTPLRKFPFDVRLTKLAVDASGLEISLAGRNLSYTN